MKVYTWVEWKKKFEAEAGGNKQKHHDLDCTALVTLEEARKLEAELKLISITEETYYKAWKEFEVKIVEALKILDEPCRYECRLIERLRPILSEKVTEKMSLESKAKTTLEIENQAKELGFKAWSCKYADIIEAKKNQENFDNQKWVLLEFAQKLEAEIEYVKADREAVEELSHTIQEERNKLEAVIIKVKQWYEKNKNKAMFMYADPIKFGDIHYFVNTEDMERLHEVLEEEPQK